MLALFRKENVFNTELIAYLGSTCFNGLPIESLPYQKDHIFLSFVSTKRSVSVTLFVYIMEIAALK